MPSDRAESPVLSGDEGLPPPAASAADAISKNRGETSLKRGRAESVEPTQPHENPASSTNAVKKNRVGPSTGQAPAKPLDPASSPNLDAEATQDAQISKPSSIKEDPEGEGDKETQNVGEVRRKVEKMSYNERLEGGIQGEDNEGIALELPEKDEDQPGSAMSISTRAASPQPAETGAVADKPTTKKNEQQSEGSELKRKSLERSQSSFAQDGVEPKRQKDDTATGDEVMSSTKEGQEPAPPAKKPATTFSSFSSTSSPFTTKASPFATAGSSSSFASAATSAGTSAPSAFAKTGFGNYSNSFSPFTKKAPAAVEDEKDARTEKQSTASFGDILSADAGQEEDDNTGKVKMTEQDVQTGEEDEDTVYQTRAKLYVMQSDGGWRERGVGTVKINVRRSDQKGARLVMRAEGVLRLILNVSLYVGMSCLEDGKHVRVTVFEEGERKFITFRTGSNKVAGELYEAIMDHVPVEPTGSPRKEDAEGTV